MSRAIDITTADGVIDAHVFTPRAADGPLPPVFLFTDIAGLRPSYMEKAQHVADGGYAVLLPNIYYRTVRGSPMAGQQLDAGAMPMLLGHASHLTSEALTRDFAALVETVDREFEFSDGPIGAVGYCMTGGFPVRLAAQFPDRVRAAAGFHSAGLASGDGSRAILDLIPAVKARVYFGHADQDPYLDADQIGAVDHALALAGVHFTTELFRGAMHGFTTPDGAAYQADADALHFKRLFTLFEESIVGGISVG